MTEPARETRDEYSRHEALHMACFLADAVDRELVEHPSIQANPEWRTLAQQAFDALYNLYQAIGAAAP